MRPSEASKLRREASFSCQPTPVTFTFVRCGGFNLYYPLVTSLSVPLLSKETILRLTPAGAVASGRECKCTALNKGTN